MRKIYIITALVLLGFYGEASADRRSRRQYIPANNWVTQRESNQPAKIGEVCEDALKEVNDKRASMGLKPFIKDELLTKGALACAKERAKFGIHGHLSSDFDYLPAGANAIAAGCGALEPSWGWETCCYTENYTYAGAAYVYKDGLRWMHIFVR